MGFLVTCLVYLLGCSLSSFVLCLFFWRSSPEWPKTARQLWVELQFQYLGFRAFLEDKFFAKLNVFVLPDSTNRLALVTGGNRGIGVHVVNKLLHSGASVIVAVRSPERALNEIAQVVDVEGFKDRIFLEKLDISDTSSVREFAKKARVRFPKIDILIHNAGIMATPYRKSDHFETQMATNYLGPFLLTHLLIPQIRYAGTEETKSRIIFVSSILHLGGNVPFHDFHATTEYYPVETYMNSKLCQVVMAKEWQRLFNRADWKVQVFSVHPGIVNTEIIQYLAKKRMFWRQNMCKTPEEGARSIVFAALSKDLRYNGGEYLSNCQVSGNKRVADNLEIGQKLFKFSCNLLGIEAFGQE